MGVVALVILSAPAVGPTLAGLLTENFNWHWIFWFPLPFLMISLVCGVRYMQNVSTITKPRIDLLSIVLSTIGFGGIVFGFSNAGETSGWSNPSVFLSLTVGIVALIGFCFRQLSLKQPVLNLQVFQYPMFALGVLLVMFCAMIIFASVLILPLYLQGGLEVSMFLAGIMMLPGGLINGVMSQLTGRLFDRIGPRMLVIPGFIIIIAVGWIFSGITQSSTITLIVALHSFLMLGTAMVGTPVQTNALNQLPRQLYPDGTAIMTTLQQVAGAIGTALAVYFLSIGREKYLKSTVNSADLTNSAAWIAGVQTCFSLY